MYAFYAFDASEGDGTYFPELADAFAWCEDAIDYNRDWAMYTGEWPIETESIGIYRVPLGGDYPHEDGDLVYLAQLLPCEPLHPVGEIDEDGYDEDGVCWKGIDAFVDCHLVRMMPEAPCT